MTNAFRIVPALGDHVSRETDQGHPSKHRGLRHDRGWCPIQAVAPSLAPKLIHKVIHNNIHRCIHRSIHRALAEREALAGSESPSRDAVQLPYRSLWNAVSLALKGPTLLAPTTSPRTTRPFTQMHHRPLKTERAAQLECRELPGERSRSPSELPASVIHHGARPPCHAARTACRRLGCCAGTSLTNGT